MRRRSKVQLLRLVHRRQDRQSVRLRPVRSPTMLNASRVRTWALAARLRRAHGTPSFRKSSWLRDVDGASSELAALAATLEECKVQLRLFTLPVRFVSPHPSEKRRPASAAQRPGSSLAARTRSRPFVPAPRFLWQRQVEA